jgi:ferrochelatase
MTKRRQAAAVQMRTRSRAVLLMAYGGPDSLADIEPYLLDVRGGRPLSPEFLGEIRDRYAQIGGRSPLLERSREQAQALQDALSNGVRTYVGMRHWHPYISETFARIRADGVTDVVAVAMTPQYSTMSVGAYRRKVEEARNQPGGSVAVRYVESWHDHPLFLEAVAEKVRQARPAETTEIVFTAHSLPARILDSGDPYQEQFLASAEGVARLLGLHRWSWAYQSQATTGEPWLGPDLGTLLDRLSEQGIRDVLVVPIGFVCDHVEVLYDIDIHYCQYAAAKGMRLRRTESLNDSPAFIRALAAIVGEALR